ncbi:DUF3211 domain-containing protein [Metallosphaera tengchongensis]|uniref:DUF3211 domain-containing protein n=1 Tax=Metallosphaera tengchongensis TaxID=1532350 RepID=A0A6N0NYU6_9CREN|nr:STK_08120 family protein [Metallosphaera tengchongensis]QKR00260.1 DUF3211 domain-containing protein [Metallosphaera tengchongensis]
METKLAVPVKMEKDVFLKLFSDQRFFFSNFTPFTIVKEEDDSVFYLYGDFYTMFSSFDVEARVRKYVSKDSVIYVLVVEPGLIQESSSKSIDSSFKGVPPKGNGKITISHLLEEIGIAIDYSGDREKPIVNFISNRMKKQIKNFDNIVNMERIRRRL